MVYYGGFLQDFHPLPYNYYDYYYNKCGGKNKRGAPLEQYAYYNTAEKKQ
jgi:hypothetical protein